MPDIAQMRALKYSLQTKRSKVEIEPASIGAINLYCEGRHHYVTSAFSDLIKLLIPIGQVYHSSAFG